ncbi:MAG: 7-carboxy-7-deazaguanine synthase QueE [Thermodesulfobacteriota bacterium]|nr:MAG: 7-carboxy-7-deazaguanine synthase QueE [Thermodesulfobacteriota bacterium]
MLVSEIFLSLQGESTFAGLPCAFVRLAGCNLSCDWCDTEYARTAQGAVEMTVGEALAELGRFNCKLSEITGGEPLLQPESLELAGRLLDGGYTVLIETNGSVELKGIDPRIIKIVDVKCPSSGHAGSFRVENLSYINPDDEVKFVIADRTDYEFAKKCLDELICDRTEKILFAPVRQKLAPKVLAEWILRDMLRVRLQLQLHSYVWEEGRGR